MKKYLNLYNVNYKIDFDFYNEKKIVEKINKDFKQYTTGTHKDYRNADKLYYLDMVRKRLHFDFEEWCDNYILDKFDYEKECGDASKEFEVEFDLEFAGCAYDDGSRGFYESNKNPAHHNLIALIIKAVMDYEDEEE